METFWRGVVDDINMNGWFQKFCKTKLPLLAQHEKDSKETNPPQTPTNCKQPWTAPSVQSSQCVLDSEVRWKRKYDVFVCHSPAQSDIEEATQLVSFLEGPPHSLRCFLWQRDTCPGGAISTEFCQAVQDSHLRAILITPTFVKDDWCGYMMHQAISEGPMSNRMIPLIHNLHHSQYPLELKFYYYIDLSKNPLQGYTHVTTTILKYLEDLLKKEMVLDGSVDGSRQGLEEEDKLMPPKHGHTGTPFH